MKHIIFTVTNDLNYDQRMIRICGSLAQAGYDVSLVGVNKAGSPLLTDRPFRQHRIRVWFKKGPGFYIEYNIKLFFYLLLAKCDGLCAIDLDTILPVYAISKLRRKTRIYDAHEYFSQMKEVVTRPRIYKIWHGIEKRMIPKFKYGYTVSNSIALTFKQLYKVDYALVRNMPLYKKYEPVTNTKKNIVYQGAVNEARGFESLIPAMRNVPAKLLVYGTGNFIDQAKALTVQYNMQDKVLFKGNLLPEELNRITAQAYIGVNLVENTGLSQYYSLANKFFDYMQHGVPQVTMNFPEYKSVNEVSPVALLIDDLKEDSISAALNKLLTDVTLYETLKANAVEAAKIYNWQNEEQTLINFYKNIFG